MSFIDKLFGDSNKRFLKTLEPLVEQINSLEKSLKDLSRDQLKEKVSQLKERLIQGEILDDILAEAFALVREAGKRMLNQRHFDVQLIGGIVLHQGQIAEMRTGEGKTLTATLPLFLNALEGKGCHLVTVNDYLSRRDTIWMGQIYNYLGLSVACLQHESSFIYDENFQPSENEEKNQDLAIKIEEKFLRPIPRKEAYLADITYGTNNEFGFDYLKDNMVQSAEQMVQRKLNFAIVDEVDSVLIDEARTPLIISAPAEESTEKYFQFAKLVRILDASKDYNIDEKLRTCTLTEEGIEKIEKALGVANIYESHGLSTVHHLEEGLKAEYLFKKDKDYVVREGEVIIVDEFTGRLMFGRRYSGGLHQAIEAKENVKVQRESVTLATITFQNYFRMYSKLAGMTGTAATESEEFAKIYNLDVTVVPTNKPMVRKDLNDSIYRTEKGKFEAIIREVKQRYEASQPVLIGTVSIEKNELLSELLERSGVPHEILNAKNHEREAQILAQAGRLKAVTVATNMAGRGVDIILGGHPADPEQALKVRELGGLHVIGTERHESRRIDNQLRGRSGRQGDTGSSRFFISMEDDLMRIFGSDRMKNMMKTLGVPEDMPIENVLISKSIESAQKKVEGHNFDIRKHLVEYDDVLNKQRENIYKKRKALLTGEADSKQMLLEMMDKEIAQVINFHMQSETSDIKEVMENFQTIAPLQEAEIKDLARTIEQNPEEGIAKASEFFQKKYEHLEADLVSRPEFQEHPDILRQLEKMLILRSIDNLWIEHLEAIDHLRTGIGLRGYGQRDPLVEYKRESFNLFQQLLDLIQDQVVHAIFKMAPAAKVATAQEPSLFNKAQEVKSSFGQFDELKGKSSAPERQTVQVKPKDETGHKIGRNDPCPCGSGLKYKRCGMLNSPEHQKLMAGK